MWFIGLLAGQNSQEIAEIILCKFSIWKFSFMQSRLWRCGVLVNALVVINEVTLRRARLVLGWVTVCGRTNHRYVTSHPGQLSLAIPLWVGAMSTSESWGVNRHTSRYTSPVSVVSQCKLVSG